MKKITAFVLALVMLLSVATLAGCEKSSYEVFSAAMEKTNSLDSYSATMNMDISMEMMGMTVEVPMVYDMKVAGIKSEKPEILADITASVLGTEMVMSLYSDAEYAYISSAEIGNMKTKLDSVSGGEYDIIDDVNDIMVVLPEEVFADILFTENSDGSKTASFTISEELFNEYYSDIISSVAEQSAGSGIDVEVSISNILITVDINKAGYIANYDMEFSMEFSMDVMGSVVDVTANTVAGMKFHNPGKTYVFYGLSAVVLTMVYALPHALLAAFWVVNFSMEAICSCLELIVVVFIISRLFNYPRADMSPTA